MATERPFDWRQADRRLYLSIAIAFAIVVLIGFGPTYYLKFAFNSPPINSNLVHLHGIIMSLWVLFFGVQVFLIRSKRHRVHMSLGFVGIALAAVILIVGFFTAAAAAKFGSSSTPPLFPAMAFMIVPMTDLVMFAGLFGAAIIYRKVPASHKRLMLLTAINFIPPALARIQLAPIQAAGPFFFFGLPAILTVTMITLDARNTGRLNRPFLIGGILLIASYPIRLALSGTDAWLSIAHWITSWAA